MSLTILVVEDYEDSRLMMKFFLENCGYIVLEAANGLEAVEILKKQAADLILMDMSMPVMDGISATKVIRAGETTARTPIIAVTAHGREYYKQAMEAGCDDLIGKPVDCESIKSFISRYLAE